ARGDHRALGSRFVTPHADPRVPRGRDMNCRHCGAALEVSMLDLGSAPPSNAYLTGETLKSAERWFPLRVLVCTSCWLVQTEDCTRSHELFDSEYAYFSGFSTSWLAHAKRYVDEMVAR